MERFKTNTLCLGVLVGASTVAMIELKELFPSITGSVDIVCFIISIIRDIKE